MTTLIILTFVTISSVLVSILVIYAIGKIKSIEESAQQSVSSGEQPGGAARSAGPFHNLEGKALWDMLSGKSVPEGVPQADLEQYREQYAPVLLKSIKAAFADGENDSKFGQPRSNPKNDRLVKTLRLSVNSWLPSNEVSSLYNAGYDSIRAEGDERSRLRMTLAEVAGSMFAKLQLPNPPGLVDSLLPQSAASSGVAPDISPTSEDVKVGDE
jgi:hypothetical protein